MGQGCLLSPTIFHIYSEEIFRSAPEDGQEGVKMREENIINIKYADYTAILVESLKDLKILVNKVYEGSCRRGINITIDKTKWMLVGKIYVSPGQHMLDEAVIEQ